VTTGGDELSNCVGEGGPRIDVEDRVTVFAVGDAALGEDDRDEMNARGVEEGEGGVFGEQANVDLRDVANHVPCVVEYG
jgi:hypothetical protein